MHKYADLLDEAIKESNLSLTEISQRCEQEGVKVTVSYLSKLRNRKMPPPSYLVTAVIAKVLDSNIERLLAAGVYDVEIESSKALEKALKFVYPEFNREVISGIVMAIIHSPHLLLNPDYTPFFEEPFDINEFEKIIQENEDFNKMISDSYEQNSISSLIKIPLVGKIAAGNAICAEENIEDYITLDNVWNLKSNEVFALKVKGDSMINSRIFENDTVIIKKQPEVENGEIAAVLVNESEATLKKVKKYENGETWLFPANDKYAPIRIENENARILGKVIQVIFEP